MFRRMTSKAAAAALALATMTTVALAGPLGLPQQSKAQRGGITPVAFVLDEGQQALITAVEGLAFVVQQDEQGNLLFIDPNNNAWVPLACCAVGQVEGEQGPVTVVGGLLWEQSGVYGAPLVYDGGFNVIFPWAPQQ
jgi:hypothetical protein